MEKLLKDVVAEIRSRLGMRLFGVPAWDGNDIDFVEMLERRGNFFLEKLKLIRNQRDIAESKLSKTQQELIETQRQLAEMKFMFAKSFNRLENDKKLEVIEAWEDEGAENDYIDETIEVAVEQISADETHGPAKYFENAFHISYPSNKKGGK